MNELINAYYEYVTMFGESPHEVPSPELREVIFRFLEKKVNFATVKFKLDNVEDECYPVPSENALKSMSWLVLNMDLDKLEPHLRELIDLPENLSDAKGKLLDFEDYLGNKASHAGAWTELASCCWHLQAPEEWPAINPSCLEYLQKKKNVGFDDSIQVCIETIISMRELSESTGISSAALAVLMYAILNEIIDVSSEDIYSELRDYAETCDKSGDMPLALQLYEILLHISPDTDIMIRKSEIYESQDFLMAAIGEVESAVETKPESLKCHKRLISLYKKKKMVKEFNAEVKRFAPIWEKKKAEMKDNI